jgi:uncharacterized short protein YbdD (DUF466 family)
MGAVIAWAARTAQSVGWFVTSLMGDRAYDTYEAHHRRAHPDEPPLNEKEFWVQRYRNQDLTPGSRCC